MSRTKLTTYLDNDLYRAISFYQAQDMDDETARSIMEILERNSK